MHLQYMLAVQQQNAWWMGKEETHCAHLYSYSPLYVVIHFWCTDKTNKTRQQWKQSIMSGSVRTSERDYMHVECTNRTGVVGMACKYYSYGVSHLLMKV